MLQFAEGQSRTNRRTGEVQVFRGGQWVSLGYAAGRFQHQARADGQKRNIGPPAAGANQPWHLRGGRYVRNPNYVEPSYGRYMEEAFLLGPPLLGALGAAVTPSVYGLARPDLIRFGSTRVPNQVISGPGTRGATEAWAVKGGGKDMPFHYHIHRYNWYRPREWFKYTGTIPDEQVPR